MEHKMRMIETAKLGPYINNARNHSPAQIAKLRASIREFGFLNPVSLMGTAVLSPDMGACWPRRRKGWKKFPVCWQTI